MWPSVPVATTASPMLLSVTRSHSRCSSSCSAACLALDGVTNGPRNLPPVGLPLDQVVLHTLLDRRQANALVVGAGQHHDRQPGRRVVGAPIRFRSGAVGQRQVQQDTSKDCSIKRAQGVSSRSTQVIQAARAGLGQGLPQEVGVGSGCPPPAGCG